VTWAGLSSKSRSRSGSRSCSAGPTLRRGTPGRGSVRARGGLSALAAFEPVAGLRRRNRNPGRSKLASSARCAPGHRAISCTARMASCRGAVQSNSAPDDHDCVRIRLTLDAELPPTGGLSDRGWNRRGRLGALRLAMALNVAEMRRHEWRRPDPAGFEPRRLPAAACLMRRSFSTFCAFAQCGAGVFVSFCHVSSPSSRGVMGFLERSVAEAGDRA
jgi:hypothetical protein